MAETYVYAVVPAGGESTFEVPGLDDDSAYTIPHLDVAAVVGSSPMSDYRGLKRDQAARYLVAHQRVVEKVMQASPLLPVKFGTVLPDESWVTRFLAQGQDLFRTTLNSFTGYQQMEVVVLWNLEEVFKQIGQEEPIVQLKAQVAARPAEQTVDARVAIGQMVQASLERRREALRQRLIPPLQEVTLDLVINPSMDDTIVANVALLVDDRGREALDETLERLDGAFEGRLLFRCVGPLPPYSFATVEVQVPSFYAVDAARRLLGLGEMGTPSEIKQAYRQLAGRVHPDHNPDDPEAETRMAELTQAYRLLTAYADSRALEQTDVVCPFLREAVEGTLLIGVTRQETLASIWP